VVVGIVTLELGVLREVALNFANTIVLALLLAIAVAFKIYILAWRAQNIKYQDIKYQDAETNLTNVRLSNQQSRDGKIVPSCRCERIIASRNAGHPGQRD